MAMQCAIERLENEAVAATLRIGNDATLIQQLLDEVERTTTLARGYLAELVSTRMQRDAYQQAADTMAAAHKVERDGLRGEVETTGKGGVK